MDKDEALKIAWMLWDGKLEMITRTLDEGRIKCHMDTIPFEQLMEKYQKSNIYKWRYRDHGKKM